MKWKDRRVKGEKGNIKSLLTVSILVQHGYVSYNSCANYFITCSRYYHVQYM